MKRGFLDTPHSKRVIEEAYAPRSPPEPSRQPKTSSLPLGSSRRTQDGGAEAAAARFIFYPLRYLAMVKVPDTTSSNTTSRILAVLSNSDEATPLSQAETREDVNGTKVEQHPEANDPKGKGKAEDVDMDDGHAKARLHPHVDDTPFVNTIPPIPPPGRPGWGRDPKETFFHLVPPSLGGPQRKRAIFRLWPRDPNGKTLVPLTDRISGTLSPDGYVWGATLYDLYYVNMVPNIPNVLSAITGSALREAMEEIGELDTAAPEIEWSKSEGKPRVLGVADTEELIRCIDKRVQGEVGDEEDHDGEDEQASEHGDGARNGTEIVNDGVKPIFNPPPQTIPVTSPFHPSHYPKPWSFVPFSNPLSILLQERVSLYLLPQTLYVHDPFCLLSARERRFPDTSWTSRPDIIRTYNLNLSESVHREVEAARVKAEELEEFKARTLIILRYQRTKEQIKNYEPIIEVPFPAYQRRMTKVEESHLYVSPVAKVGEGHHSIVYKGEWELPREIFTKPTICPLNLHKQTSTKSLTDLPTLARDGEIIEREITCFVPPDIAPADVVEMLDEKDVWNTLMKDRSVNAMHLKFTQDDEDEPTEDSHLARIRIDPPLSYESQKSCTHTTNRPVPRTAKFAVVAKLSLEYDPHLAREASNYQKFPDHFFHHYSGYTVIKQLHTIVPVNAIVPQFYGYYVPRKDPGHWQPSYLSPILLLEHCGNPIDPEELSDEDQEECASTLLRFHRSGWLHDSVAPRNFLVQLGKPTEFPLVRDNKPETSFRLIYFGRSRKYETVAEKRGDEMEALRMFERLYGKMAVTLSM
ncbi:hypothetical protein OG21DRAFT_1482220 [Imleria badia]|nr:hypothetical protein OG21DRAFT_1482220 [Imleria badia]